MLLKYVIPGFLIEEVNMFEFLKKAITKVVSWGVAKIRGSMEYLTNQLKSFEISIHDQDVQNVVLTSIHEIEASDFYTDIDRDIPIPFDKIVQTTDNLSRNFLAKAEITYLIPGQEQPYNEVLSIIYDKNMSINELEQQIIGVVNQYSTESVGKNADIYSVDIRLVEQKKK